MTSTTPSSPSAAAWAKGPSGDSSYSATMATSPPPPPTSRELGPLSALLMVQQQQQQRQHQHQPIVWTRPTLSSSFSSSSGSPTPTTPPTPTSSSSSSYYDNRPCWPLPSLAQALIAPQVALLGLVRPDIPQISAMPSSPSPTISASSSSGPIEPRILTPVRLSCDGPPPMQRGRLQPLDGNSLFGSDGGVDRDQQAPSSMAHLVQGLARLHDGRLLNQVMTMPNETHGLVCHDGGEAGFLTAPSRKRSADSRELEASGRSDTLGSQEDGMQLRDASSTATSPTSSPCRLSSSSSLPAYTSPPSLASFSYPFKFPTLTTTMTSFPPSPTRPPPSSSVAPPPPLSSLSPSLLWSSFSPSAGPLSPSPPVEPKPTTSTSTTSFSNSEDPFAHYPTRPPKKKRKPRAKITGRVCAHCGAQKTSEWRMGPEGRGTLCNACGLRYRKKLKAELQRRGGDAKIPMSALLNTAALAPPPRPSSASATDAGSTSRSSHTSPSSSSPVNLST